MAESPARLEEQAVFGLGALGKEMVPASMSAFLMMYFTDMVGVSAAFIAMLFLIARLWDAFNDPIMGWIVDNTKSRWGKFRPWILIGTLVNSVIAILLFTNPVQFFNLSVDQAMVYCAVLYILWGMSYTMVDIPYWSFIPALSSASKARNLTAALSRAGGSIGGFVATFYGAILITLMGESLGATASDGIQRYIVFVCVVFIILELICVKIIREHVQTPKRQKITIKGMASVIVKNDQLLVIIILTLILVMGQNLFNGTVLYYFKYVLSSMEAYPYFMICGGIFNFVAFLAFPLLVKMTSRRCVYIGAALLMLSGYLGMFFMGGSGIGLFLSFFCISSVGSGLLLVVTTVMLADTVDYGEYKLGIRTESIVFSMQSMIAKLSMAFAGFLSGLTLTLVGYVPNAVQSESALLGMRIAILLVPAITLLVMLLVYLKCYKLDGEFYKNMMAALQKSRDEANAQHESTSFDSAALTENAILVEEKSTSKD